MRLDREHVVAQVHSAFQAVPAILPYVTSSFLNPASSKC